MTFFFISFHITRYYTSVELACWLLRKNISTIGVIDPNRKGIGGVGDTTGRKHQSSVFWTHTENRHLGVVSHVVQKKGLKQNVLMMSTHPQPIYGITKDDNKRKPAVIKLYDFTKGGLDIVDQRIDNFTVKAKTKQWTVCALAYMLDTARVNCQTVRSLNNNVSPRLSKTFELIFAMGKSMVLPLIMRRMQNTYGLSDSIVETMKEITKADSKQGGHISSHEYKKKHKAYQATVISSMMKDKDFLCPKKPLAALKQPLTKLPPPTKALPPPELMKPLRIHMMRPCRACIREISAYDIKINVKEIPRTRFCCEICGEPVCLKKHGFMRCPECNRRRS